MVKVEEPKQPFTNEEDSLKENNPKHGKRHSGIDHFIMARALDPKEGELRMKSNAYSGVLKMG